jgi:hypothetical protein
MGRKPLSGECKTTEIAIRLTRAERAELDQAAGDSWTSTWARDLLLKAARAKARKKRGR